MCRCQSRAAGLLGLLESRDDPPGHEDESDNAKANVGLDVPAVGLVRPLPPLFPERRKPLAQPEALESSPHNPIGRKRKHVKASVRRSARLGGI